MNEQASKYRSLDEWFNTPRGHRVALAFTAELNTIRQKISGERLLQMGNCGANLWLPSLHYQHKWVVAPYVDKEKIIFTASLNELPVERDSVDCIIAPLTLEACTPEKNPLDEIDRILKPMGYSIFFGINPWSFWGYALRWGSLACFGAKSSTLTSSFFIQREMMYRGYRYCFHSSFYYIPPIKNERLIRNLEFLNEMGKMVSPVPAGFYCLIMQKYQHCHPSLLVDRASNDLLLRPAISS